jgi:DNA-binding transcriptional ArsR family regulator
VRLHFRASDLRRVRIGSACGPWTETVFSHEALRRRWSPPAFGARRRSVIDQLDADVLALAALLPPGAGSDLVARAAAVLGLEEAASAVPGAPPESEHEAQQQRAVVAMVDRLHDKAVKPYWDAARARLEAEHARLMRTMADEGVDGLLGTLHPAMEWKPPVLHVPSGPVGPSGQSGPDCDLGGRGLVVVPSLFCPPGHPPTVAAVEAGVEEWPHVLFYPALQDGADLRSVLGECLAEKRRPGTLAALLGRTRAEVLESLGGEHATTGELARRRSISPASASEHATVLRRAGLVHSRRHGGSVVHTVTPLGQRLLDATGPTHPR